MHVLCFYFKDRYVRKALKFATNDYYYYIKSIYANKNNDDAFLNYAPNMEQVNTQWAYMNVLNV